MSLQSSFEEASQRVKTLKSKPDNETLLKLYSLFKQGQEGQAVGKRPGMMNMVARAKFDAWANLGNMGQDAAKQAYIDLVDQLIKKQG